MMMVAPRLVCGRHDETVRLERAVDSRDVGTRNQAGRGRPRGLAVTKLLRALETQLDQVLAGGNFLGVEELVVGESDPNRFVEDLDVGEQIRVSFAERLDLLVKLLEAALQLGAVRLGHGDARGR